MHRPPLLAIYPLPLTDPRVLRTRDILIDVFRDIDIQHVIYRYVQFVLDVTCCEIVDNDHYRRLDEIKERLYDVLQDDRLFVFVWDGILHLSGQLYMDVSRTLEHMSAESLPIPQRIYLVELYDSSIVVQFYPGERNAIHSSQ